MPEYRNHHYFEPSRDNLTAHSSGSSSIDMDNHVRHHQRENVPRRRLSLMPPREAPHPGPPSSIRDSDNTTVIKHKINSKPFTGQQGEEYQTTKKVNVKTTKNTERRVQRQVVLEDGRVLHEEPPHIVHDVIEDTRNNEYTHLEDRDLDTEIRAIISNPYLNTEETKKPVQHGENHNGFDVAEDEGEIVDDSFQRTVNTRDVKESLVRTQVAQDLGMLSRRGVERILRGEETLQQVLDRRNKRLQRKHETAVVEAKPVSKTYKAESRRKVVDTEDVRNISRKMKNGKIKTETVRTEKHEIFDDKAAPDDGRSFSSASTLSRDLIEHDGERYRCVKREDFTDFFRTGKDENEPELLGHGPHITTEEREILTRRQGDIENWQEVCDDRILQRRQKIKESLNPGDCYERTDALTKKPLNLYREEKTRKKETDKWLERHFGGSEWSLLTGNSFQSTSTTVGGSATLRRGHFDPVGSMQPEINTRYDPRRDEKNLRRSQSFNAVPIHQKSSDFHRGPGERIVRQTTTTINPGLEKVVYSSVTKSVAPPRDFSGELHTGTGNSRLYRSALSLNNVDKRQNKRDDKFLRGSTASLIQTTRDIPITVEETPVRPPRKENSEKDLTRKDLFFDATFGNVGSPKLKSSMSYSELARTSMLNRADAYKNQKSSKDDSPKTSNDWKHRSYLFGEEKSLSNKNESPERNTLERTNKVIFTGSHKYLTENSNKFLSENSNKFSSDKVGRTSRAAERKGSPESVEDSYLRVQSEPPLAKKVAPQPIKEEIFHETPKVRRVYPTVEKKSSNQGRVVYRSESRKEPKRSQSQQPLYRTELPTNELYPSGNETYPDHSPSHNDYWTNQINLTRSQGDLIGDYYKKEEKKYYFSTEENFAPQGTKDYLGYRSMERSDGWDSPLAWMARAEKSSHVPRRSKSFMVGGRSGGSAGDTTSHSSSSASYGHSRPKTQVSNRVLHDHRGHHSLHRSGAEKGHYHYTDTPTYMNTTTSFNMKKNVSKESRPQSPSSNIIYHYNHDPRGLHSRPHSPGAVILNGGKSSVTKDAKKSETKKSIFSKATGTRGIFEKLGKPRDVYEFEKKVPMHSSSLEAQKFKTIIFLSGH